MKYCRGKLSWKKDQKCAWVCAFRGCWEVIPEKVAFELRPNGVEEHPFSRGGTIANALCEVRFVWGWGGVKRVERKRWPDCVKPCRPLKRLQCFTLRRELIGEHFGLIDILTGSGLLMCLEWTLRKVRAGPGDQVKSYCGKPRESS